MRYVAFVCLVVALPATHAMAADPPMISLGLGGTDVLKPQLRSATDIRLEYRSGLSLLPEFEDIFKVKPWAGIETTQRLSIWGGGGILVEIPFGRHWVLTPNVGVGAYSHDKGKKLGSDFEVRSTLEGGYVFEDGVRVVASVGHTSNAGTGFRNPGTESVVLSVQVPLHGVAGLVEP